MNTKVIKNKLYLLFITSTKNFYMNLNEFLKPKLNLKRNFFIEIITKFINQLKYKE